MIILKCCIKCIEMHFQPTKFYFHLYVDLVSYVYIYLFVFFFVIALFCEWMDCWW